MSIGIDLFPFGLSCLGSGNQSDYKSVKHGIIGIPPRINEPILWNEPHALRDSAQGQSISLTNAWSKFMEETGDVRKDDDSTKIHYLNYTRDRISKSSAEIIADAVKSNVPISNEKTVYTIDNNLNEFKQDTLLKALKNEVSGIELLWRPVAVAMDYLNSKGRENFKESEKLLIVDLDSYIPELTILKLKSHKNQLVPVRTLPKQNQRLFGDYSSYELKRKFVKKISNDNLVEEQLIYGPCSGDIFSFFESGYELEGDKKRDIFFRSGLTYKKFNLEEQWIQEIADFDVNNTDFQEVINIVRASEDYDTSDYILWNGFSCRIQKKEVFNEKESQLDHLAVARGAADYAHRLNQGLPTYLDTLPGLEIMSKVEGRGIELFTIIEAGEVEGGQPKYTPVPIERFRLEKETPVFTSVLRNSTDDTYKKLETRIPTHENDLPVIIKGMMKPAHGNAVVTIEGKSENKDIFGERNQIELDWKSMEPFEFTQYSGPSFYAVEGRIKGHQTYRDAAQECIDNQNGIFDRVNFDGGKVQFSKIHEPWGYKNPFGERINEPTRALFGAKDENDPIIDKLALGISNLIDETIYKESDRHKFLNYMFRYAPESFLDELRDLFSSDYPELHWSTVYAVGRTFYKPEDFELYVDFFLKNSVDTGYPSYPNKTYTKMYYWSYFRALCYYEETINIPVEKAEKVLSTINNIVRERSVEKWAPKQTFFERGYQAKREVENFKKYLLCSILFSLRFRKISSKFLDLGSSLFNEMENIVKNQIPPTDYPKTMFGSVQNDNLNDYVFRFLSKEETEDDLAAIKGLVTSI